MIEVFQGTAHHVTCKHSDITITITIITTTTTTIIIIIITIIITG